MNCRPRFHFNQLQRYGSGGPNVSYLSGYGALPPPMVPSNFKTPPHNHCMVNDRHFQQPQIPSAVQRYLDISNYDQKCGLIKQEQEIPSKLAYNKPCKNTFQNKKSLDAHVESYKYHNKGKMKIVLDTPEQIAKWRADRRRNYPTAINVAKKEAEEQRRKDNGQTVLTKGFRYNCKQGWKIQKAKRNNKNKKKNWQTNNGALAKNIDQLENQQTGRHCLQNDLNNKEHKDEESKQAMGLFSLGTLAAAYNMSDEDDEKTLEQKDIDKPSKLQPECKKQKLQQNCFETAGKIQRRSKKKNSTRNKHNQSIVGLNHSRPTLLEMLLAPDIRHERNVMLQCIHFIVKKNFFGIE